jgi:guanylate kinase
MLEANPYDLFHPLPLLIVISGPSGVGKDAVLNRLREKEVSFHFVVTATTRARREGERDGFDYIFVSVEEFERMIAEDELLEYAKVYGDYKGIPKQHVREAIESGKDVVLRIDVQGAESIRKLCPEVVTIFLIVRDENELVYRLKNRKSEPPDKIQQRIETARNELRRMGEFDYVVENPDKKLDDTVEIIEAIIQAEHHRVQHRKVNL